MKMLLDAQKTQLEANHKLQQRRIENDLDSIDFTPVVKFFNPYGAGTWLATEMDPETGLMFGLCLISHAELGYFHLSDMPNGIERDRHFTATKTISDYAESADRTGYIAA